MRKRELKIVLAGLVFAMAVSFGGCGKADIADMDAMYEDIQSGMQDSDTDGKTEETTEENTEVASSELDDEEEVNISDGSSDVIVKDDPLTAGLTQTSEGLWVNTDSQYTELVDKVSEMLTSSGTFTGTLILATDNDIILSANMNAYENDEKTLVNSGTIYETGDLTQTLTQIAILQLAKEDKLKLTDPLDKYFPEYKLGNTMTVGDLLNMEAKIPDYCFDPETFYGTHDTQELEEKFWADEITDEEFLEALYDAPLYKNNYAWSGHMTEYHLLAMIVEQVTEQKYCDYVKEHIFDVAQMETATSMEVGNVTSLPVDGHAEDILAMPNTLRGVMDMHASAADVLAYDRAIMNQKLVGPDVIEEMFTFVGAFHQGWARVKKDAIYFQNRTYTTMGLNAIYRNGPFGNLYLIQFHPTFKNSYYIDELKRKVADAYY